MLLRSNVLLRSLQSVRLSTKLSTTKCLPCNIVISAVPFVNSALFNYTTTVTHIQSISQSPVSLHRYSTSNSKFTLSTPPPSLKSNEEKEEEEEASMKTTYLSRLSNANRLKTGVKQPSLPLDVIIRSGAASFFGIGCLTGLHYGIFDGNMDITMVLGSFGATAVLVYGYPAAPFSQPKNVIIGHTLSAFIGICAHMMLVPIMDGSVILAAPLAVSLSTMGMMMIGCVHPPAGGTCLIACLGKSSTL
jgi:hypothetical protein